MEAVITKKGVSTMNSAAVVVDRDHDEVLHKMKESGKKLNGILNIRSRHINKAIKDARKEWK